MQRVAFLVLVCASAAPAALRVGFGEAPPYNSTGRDGKPQGFVIDVATEAARRAGIALEWVRAGTAAENNRALAEGRLDVIAMAVATRDRQEMFYVSPSWWSEDTIMVVRADRLDVDINQPRLLSLPQRASDAASHYYPASKQLLTSSATQAMAQVCREAADAAIFGSAFVYELVNARPAACEDVQLRVTNSPVSVPFSVIARKGSAAHAERLHRHIVEMTLDGTLTQIARRHPPTFSPHAASMSAALRERFEREQMRTLLIFLGVLAACAVIVVLRQMRSQRQLRRVLNEQTQTAEQLRDSQSSLSQRTGELLRSNEDLQAFAYSVSHDLQEPLRNQSIYSELLERRHSDALSPEARQYLQVIRTSAVRMQEMMRSLLVYSRAGQADRERNVVACGEVVSRVLQDLHFLVSSTGARIEVGALPALPAWEDRIQQVFQNLIENAIKYRRPGATPHIRISAERSGEFWTFRVQDNGIGFRQEYADKVFGVFKRLHRHDSYGGSGIGLAVCRRIVERHGGHIWAESNEGGGSTFFFTLPAATSPDKIQQQDQIAGPAQSA